MTLVADNQGAHYCMRCKTGGTRYPCRWCSNNSTECLMHYEINAWLGLDLGSKCGVYQPQYLKQDYGKIYL